MRSKLQEAFAPWYDFANNEEDKDCIILAIRITSATVIKDHGAVRYNLDFVNKVETEEEKDQVEKHLSNKIVYTMPFFIDNPGIILTDFINSFI